VLAGIVLPLLPVSGGEAAPEELLPENSLAALVLPDLQAAKTQYAGTRLAEMFSQPALQEFLQPVLDEIKKQDAETLKANPGALTFNADLFNGSLAAALFGSPGDPTSGGVVAIFAPKVPDSFLASLPPAIAKALKDGNLPLPPTADAGLAWANGRLVFCAPKAQLPRMLAKVTGAADAPKGSLAQTAVYAKARAQLAGAAGWAFAAPQAMFTLTLSFMPDPVAMDRAKATWSALGLNTLDSVSVGLTFKDKEPIGDVFLGLSGATTGIFSLLCPPDAVGPVADAFRIAAPDSPYVATGYFNFAGILPLIKASLAATDPQGGQMLDNQLQALSGMLQFDLQKDVFENIDGHFIAAQTSVNTAIPVLPLPGIVLSFGAKNPAKLTECLTRVETLLKALPPPVGGIVKLKQVKHAEKAIYYLSGPILPLSPAMCIADNRLLLGTTLNAVRRSLEQAQKTENILGNKDFQQALARATAQPFSAEKIPAQFAYGADAGAGTGALLLASTYLAAAGGLQVANIALAAPAGQDQQALETRVQQSALAMFRQYDLGFWPDQVFFSKYQRPTVGIIKTDAAGIHWQTELPPPVPAASHMGSAPVVIAVVAIGAGMALPVLARSRESARRVASASNLNQMLKAAYMYADVPANKGEFPADPALLVPNYIADARVFQNPRFANQDVGYMWVAGVTNEMAMAVVAYEAPPPGDRSGGRNVAIGAGTVEWVDEAHFQKLLEDTGEILKKAKREMKVVPISMRAMQERAPGVPQRRQRRPRPAEPNRQQPDPGKQPEF
jgi:hypothetical protein